MTTAALTVDIFIVVSTYGTFKSLPAAASVCGFRLVQNCTCVLSAVCPLEIRVNEYQFWLFGLFQARSNWILEILDGFVSDTSGLTLGTQILTNVILGFFHAHCMALTSCFLTQFTVIFK
jgi:hypothetical protein